MVVIPFIYFICVFVFLWKKQHTWNMDLAATTLLIVISFCAIMIDINNIYGNYGINENYLTLPTLILFCAQWTFVIYLLHVVSQLPLQQHPPGKSKLLYTLLLLLIFSSCIMMLMSASDIKEALLMDMADVRSQHYEDLSGKAVGKANYLMLIPNILTSQPFPTLALFLWFYLKTFTRCNIIIRAGILVASIVQAVIAIIMAGRAAMVYWIFDFFLLYSYFYKYLSKGLKRKITLIASSFIILAGSLFIVITIARFDGTSYNRDPFESLYGYAGQHVNNFCTMFVNGSNTPLLTERIFPLTSKIMKHPYDMVEHYNRLSSHTSHNILVSVFDTFGGEIFLDLGWFGYIFFFILLFLFTIYIRNRWTEIRFDRVFILVIIIAFFCRGLFAWPFTHHYSTLALMATVICHLLFKYRFVIYRDDTTNQPEDISNHST